MPQKYWCHFFKKNENITSNCHVLTFYRKKLENNTGIVYQNAGWTRAEGLMNLGKLSQNYQWPFIEADSSRTLSRGTLKMDDSEDFQSFDFSCIAR